MTPHLGAATDEAQTAVALAIADQVADALLRGVVVNAVNLPADGRRDATRSRRPRSGSSETMGRFLAQMAEGRMQEARLTYAGEIVGAADRQPDPRVRAGPPRHDPLRARDRRERDADREERAGCG